MLPIIDWVSFFYGFAAGVVLVNLLQILTAFLKFKKASKEKLRIEAEMKSLEKTIENASRELKEEIARSKEKKEMK